MKCEACGGNRTPEHCNCCELFASGITPDGHRSTCWPLTSEAMAVHADQVPEAQARADRHGISVTYRPDGKVVIPDRGNRKKLLRLEGFHDRNGGYGD